ncbi:hypothetical protein C5Y96_18890 [Blastopirellula marina]|uniref:Uncharacterized protein n=1 Tax=Blastopirellula marina TaxID=124 RepID=A0A2S8F604_9BACT|nr:MULTISPECIES: hypothetical protein [Pirellulaceae]PQO27595.1 hypothetical protein C5Y96_18890 [Blastopirellula marina]RCS48132.1 hypothetical protein DTL36_18915 [Bremerella cremea]
MSCATFAELKVGKPSRINDFDTILHREEDYLVYIDKDGNENRCQILMATEEGDLLQFICASHGQETSRHSVTGTDGIIEFE